MHTLALPTRQPDSASKTLLLGEAALKCHFLCRHCNLIQQLNGWQIRQLHCQPTCRKHAVYALLAPVGSQMG